MVRDRPGAQKTGVSFSRTTNICNIILSCCYNLTMEKCQCDYDLKTDTLTSAIHLPNRLFVTLTKLISFLRKMQPLKLPKI